MLISQDFKEFLQSLNDNQVRYLIIGGYAVAFHGHPRYTKDLDIWIEPNRINLQHLIQALADFGVASVGLDLDDFLDPDQVIQLGYPPNRIDLLTFLEGVDFPACYGKRVEVNLEGTIAKFIDLASLKENNRATGRHQDLADLEHLQ